MTPQYTRDAIDVKLANASSVQCHSYIDTQVIFNPGQMVTRARFWILDTAIEPILGNDWIVASRAWIGKHCDSVHLEGKADAIVMETKQSALSRKTPKVVKSISTSPKRAGCTTSRADAFSRGLPMMSVPHGGTKKQPSEQTRQVESSPTPLSP